MDKRGLRRVAHSQSMNMVAHIVQRQAFVLTSSLCSCALTGKTGPVHRCGVIHKVSRGRGQAVGSGVRANRYTYTIPLKLPHTWFSNPKRPAARSQNTPRRSPSSNAAGLDGRGDRSAHRLVQGTSRGRDRRRIRPGRSIQSSRG